METQNLQSEKDREIWKLAKKRVSFKRHLATYLVINTFFWIIWFLTDHKKDDMESGGIPWPIFPMLGWGIGIMFGFLNAYVFTKHDAIEKEFNRLKNDQH